MSKQTEMQHLSFMAKMMPEKLLLKDLVAGLLEIQINPKAEKPLMPLFLLFLKWSSEDMSLQELLDITNEVNDEAPKEEALSEEEAILEKIFEGMDVETINAITKLFAGRK